MVRDRRKVGEILRDWGILNSQQLLDATRLADQDRRRLSDVLVERGFASESDVTKALAAQFDMEFIDLDEPDALDKTKLDLLSSEIIKKYLVLPRERTNGRLKVIVHDPMDIATLDNLRFIMNCEIEPSLAARSKIRDFIDRYFNETQLGIEEACKQMAGDGDNTAIDLEFISPGDTPPGAAITDAQQAPIIRLVDQVIIEAVNSRASDIHIEPFANRVRLRYRIDGVCHERNRIPKRTQAAVIARLKIMAGVRVEEKRTPQDGRIKLKIAGEVVDFRFSSCPAYHGESCVLRILRAGGTKIGLTRLGLREDTQEEFNRIIRRPNGIFLVTGPTGSGKTTTLYSALEVLNRPDRKIITAEDPVEYNCKGINQCQVNEQVGFSFASILRAMLRQAPNIILVGEIRDKEVADVAIQAALTGHLVFSTLHTNDAPSAITRLIDMGVKPFLVASSVQAILAQRLIRVLCSQCKQPDPAPNPRIVRLCGLTHEDLETHTIYRPVGCQRCDNTGYFGREGIFEMMNMSHELRELAFKQAPLSKIRATAMASGMRTLLGDGRFKILDGLTTPDEVCRVAQIQGILESEEYHTVDVP